MIAADGPSWFSSSRACFAHIAEFTSLLDGLNIELLKLKQESAPHWIGFAHQGSTRILIVRLTGRYRVRLSVPERHILVQVELGRGGTRTLAGVSLKGEEILVGRAPAEFDMVLSGPHESVSLLLGEAAFLRALADQAPGLDKLVCTPSSHVLSSCRQRLGRLKEAALAALEHPHNDSSSTELQETVAAVFVDAFERTSHSRLGGPRFQRRPVVERVEEFMTANLGQQVTLEDLCQVARASQRTVEYAFSITYGMGPKQYLTLLRLNEVHRCLKSGAAEAIMQIAGRFGFQHMGHFSSQYRRLFGETPRKTQHRAQGTAYRDTLAVIGGMVSPAAFRSQGEFVNRHQWPDRRASEPGLRGKNVQPLLGSSQETSGHYSELSTVSSSRLTTRSPARTCCDHAADRPRELK